MAAEQSKQKVIFDHDGGVDDLLSLMLLLTMQHVELLAVTITPADCYLSDATVSTQKILAMFGQDHIPIAQGRLHGINAFPAEWKAQPKICNAFPDMLTQKFNSDSLSAKAADELIAELLMQHDKVSLLMTGPCSNLVAAIEYLPAILPAIEQLIWMGGAVDVPGNVAMHNHNKSAEWNAYWDPIASAKLFTYGIEIKLISLDATNCLPVNLSFLSDLAAQKGNHVSHLAGQFWATTINSIPSYEFTYFMWDVLATSVLALPSSAIKFEDVELNVLISEPNAGQTYRCQGSGQWAKVATWVDKQQVLDYVLEQFKRDF
ncbi:nucleoside hydrolase [Aliiglaciecola sp. LCG003]|uniref:nucleoside hydrolase n=1 Tax=Aliiglaciecola sp. LCG003 TaxID=3053655 RepID=UPI002573D08B|nr:nucleoside hydrolase [Aliiglaciecola sp. LCG003]WJG07915.1 nucleoside hydrolase [Aliiglaciecola sp. LCG003]